MVRRFSLQPPIDVEAIARRLADVTDKSFPIPIDGLCLDLKSPGKRPKVWISKNQHHVRRRFTLAHEIGHIVIPWHSGSIVDDLEAPRRANGRYKIMEGEANRFAAELLMPTEWVIDLADRCEHIAGLLRTIHQVCDVSFEAALYRTMKYAKSGFVMAEVKDSMIVNSRKTRGTRSHPPEPGSAVEFLDMPTAEDPIVIGHGESLFYFWQVDNDVEAGIPPSTPWRVLLEEILTTVPEDLRQVTLARINAVVGYAIGRLPKGSPVDELYGRALAATKNRTDRDPWLDEAIHHKRFNDYVLARCYERARVTSLDPE
jgi:Zn-dependent peptidase ImmA (M78 family)